MKPKIGCGSSKKSDLREDAPEFNPYKRSYKVSQYSTSMSHNSDHINGSKQTCHTTNIPNDSSSIISGSDTVEYMMNFSPLSPSQSSGAVHTVNNSNQVPTFFNQYSSYTHDNVLGNKYSMYVNPMLQYGMN